MTDDELSDAGDNLDHIQGMLDRDETLPPEWQRTLAALAWRLLEETVGLRALCGRAYDDLIDEHLGTTPGSATLPNSLCELAELLGRDPDAEIAETAQRLDRWLDGDDLVPSLDDTGLGPRH